ncbi:Alpha-galactosidase AgaA [Clostridium felsineum DSM 794]|nr:Alpha-galactosidase AgaA [Clostridium felsineum DSM 794]
MMSIEFNKDKKIFHLKAKGLSYVIGVFQNGKLGNIYFGKRIKELNYDMEESLNLSAENIPLDVMKNEYPEYGTGDFRKPAYQVEAENGTAISNLEYVSHKIYKGKPELKGLPAVYVEEDSEADTLEVVLEDSILKLKVSLLYTVFRDHNVITRSVRFINNGEQNIKLLKAMSMNIDFDNADYDMLQLSGAWCRERSVLKRSLVQGSQVVESSRGVSSHQQNPFIALMSKNCDEENGEVYGFSFVYSGNFLAEVEVDQHFKARVSIGINPFTFSWLLEKNESLTLPEVVIVYSEKGLGDMSRTYHRLYRKRLCRGVYRDKERPVLVNNWEATYFDFTEEKIKNIAQEAGKLGLELFVLDDGWFKKRNADNSSLGDWIEDKRKLPSGLNSLAKSINKMGVYFGLWVEPEMISEDSDLYRQHPDYCMHVPNRKRSAGRYERNQLVLDLSREDVCVHVFRMISKVLKSAPIAYVKWDMNRSITELGSEKLPIERQREVAHRYVLGLYRVMYELTKEFPDVLFESCSSGGARFDPGMLFYMPQTWTSDCTDAIERLKIQYGTSIVYPAITMGAHVSACPNHQVGRIEDLMTRGNAAMSGNFGYELDLTKLTEEEKKEVKNQVDKYKNIRNLIQFGDFYRILSPFDKPEASWIFVNEDKTEAIFFYFNVLLKPNIVERRVRFKGLNENLSYRIKELNAVFSGEELMYRGIIIPKFKKDFESLMYRLKSEKN